MAVETTEIRSGRRWIAPKADLDPPAWSTMTAVLLLTPISALWLLAGIFGLFGMSMVGQTMQPGVSLIVRIWFWTWVLVASLTIAAAQGILRRFPKARTWAIFICAVQAVTTLPFALAALSRPEAIAEGWGIVLGLTEVAIIVLLTLPKTRVDFEKAQIKRLEAKGYGGDLLHHSR